MSSHHITTHNTNTQNYTSYNEQTRSSLSYGNEPTNSFENKDNWIYNRIAKKNQRSAFSLVAPLLTPALPSHLKRSRDVMESTPNFEEPLRKKIKFEAVNTSDSSSIANNLNRNMPQIVDEEKNDIDLLLTISEILNKGFDCEEDCIDEFYEVYKLDELEKSISPECPPPSSIHPHDTCVIPITRNLASSAGINPCTILTGDLCEIPLLNCSPELKENLRIAKKIISQVRTLIPFSENYFQRSKIFRSNFDEAFLKRKSELIQTSFDSMVDIFEEITGIDFETTSEVAQKYKIGNCTELSIVGQECGQKMASTEIYDIQNGNHVFLVIGRDAKSLPWDYKNWGLNAVVCDSWSGACFPASKIEEYLMDYDDNIELDGINHTKVKLFDPTKQFLNIVPKDG